MYAFLGIALWFAFVFMILDVVNYGYQCAMARMNSKQKRILSSQAFVSTPTQIWLVLVMTTGLGVYFGESIAVASVRQSTLQSLLSLNPMRILGLIFGLFNVPGNPDKQHREIFYTTPIGKSIGAIVPIMVTLSVHRHVRMRVVRDHEPVLPLERCLQSRSWRVLQGLPRRRRRRRREYMIRNRHSVPIRLA